MLLNEPDIPDTAISYLLKGLSVLDETGTDRATVLEGTGITEFELGNINGLISSNKIMRLISNIEKKTGLIGIGLFFGSRLDITSHGMLGVATISQKNWIDAANLLSSGCKSRYHSIHIEPYESEPYVGIRYSVDHPDERYRTYISDLFTATLFRNIPYFIDVKPSNLRPVIHYQFSEPNYASFYKHLFLVAPRFGQPFNEIMIEKRALSNNLENHNLEVSSSAKRTCKSQIPQTGKQSLSHRILRLIEKDADSKFSLIAKQLNVGERTLRRKLLEEGTTFRKIVEEKKNSEAKYLLENSDISISKIAKKQGYYDPASFCKMFKKWNGISPKAYRTSIARDLA